MKRTNWIALLGSLLLASCGGSPSVGGDDDDSTEVDGGSGTGDDDDGQDGGSGDDDDDDSDDDDGPSFVGDDDGPTECEPVTCAEVGADCGPIVDGCGGIVECGTCSDGGECGIVAHNVCTVPADLCIPVSREEACEGKACGTETDGCEGGEVYSCGECEDNERCGLGGPFQCGEVVVDNPDECVAQITSCADVGAECGQIGNGCGGLIDCDAETGGCEDGIVCGLAGPQQCGDEPACVPLDPAEACEGKCGIVSNGCGQEIDGGIIDCSEMFPCPNGEVCGGGGVPNQCGTAEGLCEPIEEADACGARECGIVGDGCDGQISCGSCAAGSVCRGGMCEVLCTPQPEAQACAGRECGLVSDGCSGSYDCGACGAGEVCGLLAAFQCDAQVPPECMPTAPAAACAGRECGLVYDGCGTDAANIIDCSTVNGGCGAGEYCGLVTPFQCDPPPPPNCTPAASCAELGWGCGFAVDDCGNVLDCSTEGLVCDSALETCIGGIDGPTQCVGPFDGGGGDCDVCDAIPDCAGQGQTTTLSGRVITPGRTDGNTANQVRVPNAFVYILRSSDMADLPGLSSGIPGGGTACDRCEDQDFGPVLNSAVSDANGDFTMDGNIPVGEPFILVTKIGKFRRAQVYTVPAGDACGDHQLPLTMPGNPTRLPRDMSDGDGGVYIPQIAVTTGPIDAMECVFEKVGIAHSEFTNPADGGRIHLFRGGGGTASGARIDTNTPADSTLYGTLATLEDYDMVVADCEGGEWDDDYTQRDSWGANVRQFVNRGGRMFASHLSHTWLNANGTLAYAAGTAADTGLGPAATWQDTANTGPDDGTGIVSLAALGGTSPSPRIDNFAEWMINEAVTTAPDYEFDIVEPRSQVTGLGTWAEEFVHCDGQDCTGGNVRTQQFSFNTPYADPDAEVACGRVAYSGFHVVAGGGFSPYANVFFPDHCSGNLSDQEKVLLYMLFDLGTCVGDTPEPPECTPLVCNQECGTASDGCGGTLNCGTCPMGEICVAGMCEELGCTPTTCGAEGATCGFIADGCGGLLECGDCPAGQVCGLVAPNQCAITCTPNDPVEACEGACGFVSDGCGGVHQCPDCSGTLSCVAGMCTDQECDPMECPADLECGVVSDGCDGTANCGDCEPPEVCGGGGIPNRCGIPDCDPLSCADLNAMCGWIGDGCGNAVDCGECPMGQVCGAGGPNRCAGCQPRDCEDAGAECGAIGDGCGGVVQCGPCPEGEICGAEEPNQCGEGPMCPPRTCQSIGAECGQIGDGCGGVLDCGDCDDNEICGIETPFQCGPPPECDPTSCEAEDAECGALGDGCGNLLDCGPCQPGFSCGVVGPNKCSRDAGEER